MQSLTKFAFAAVFAGLFGAGAPAFAQSPGYPNYYAPYPNNYLPGYFYPPYQSYPSNRQGPDGTYDSLADFVSDIRGRPCDLACTQRLQERWAEYYRSVYAHRRYPLHPQY